MYIVGIGKTTFCTQFARAFVGRDGSNIGQFMAHWHNSKSAQLFVALLKQIVAHSLTIGLTLSALASSSLLLLLLLTSVLQLRS
jgi:hypothetical protein